VFVNNRWRNVTSQHIADALRLAAIANFHLTGISPDDISARSLRAGGAMALLCARIDTDIIRLVGRWRSDEMLRYLHAQAYPLMHTFATSMLLHGSFSLVPGSAVPASALPLLNQVPPAA
jgi:ABC-type xylose transport system substrate-binding protein